MTIKQAERKEQKAFDKLDYHQALKYSKLATKERQKKTV